MEQLTRGENALSSAVTPAVVLMRLKGLLGVWRTKHSHKEGKITITCRKKSAQDKLRLFQPFKAT